MRLHWPTPGSGGETQLLTGELDKSFQAFMFGQDKLPFTKFPRLSVKAAFTAKISRVKTEKLIKISYKGKVKTKSF